MFNSEDVQKVDRRENQKFLRGGAPKVLVDYTYTIQAVDNDGSQVELEVTNFPRRSKVIS